MRQSKNSRTKEKVVVFSVTLTILILIGLLLFYSVWSLSNNAKGPAKMDDPKLIFYEEEYAR